MSGISRPREVLARYRRAMLDGSADALAELYAEDAVHEFPFRFPGAPAGFVGREAVREGYRGMWSGPVRAFGIREVAVHETADPEVIVVEQVVSAGPGESPAAEVPGLLVLRVGGDGLLTHVRDYMDVTAVAAARGGA
ncbi:nuclear transport factor 2 family protein [Streptomyces hoynatensis]|uniref:Nuclear transport factor 2 family protein n=1 Tax=Streptomyces hoynatensis TaxID=1141874 RepID=A0A3A9YWI6_9ACTN|nr:nuclear transport factor 2 family protein [Streptomyces hoynatensis]RKN40442.1 nuclear transport factor 2 family protein [Streptomyces hoynatensis]